jgi:hypothetical protein
MPRISGLTVLGLGLAIAACTRFADVGTDTIGPGYATAGGEWSSGGGITVVSRAFERNGVTVVCGAWTTDQQSTMTILLNDDVIEAGALYIGAERAAWNLGFMAEIPYSDNIAGAQANCVASALPWRAELADTAPQVRLPPLRFTVSRNPVQQVSFRQGRRPSVIE